MTLCILFLEIIALSLCIFGKTMFDILHFVYALIFKALINPCILFLEIIALSFVYLCISGKTVLFTCVFLVRLCCLFVYFW